MSEMRTKYYNTGIVKKNFKNFNVRNTDIINNVYKNYIILKLSDLFCYFGVYCFNDFFQFKESYSFYDYSFFMARFLLILF